VLAWRIDDSAWHLTGVLFFGDFDAGYPTSGFCSSGNRAILGVCRGLLDGMGCVCCARRVHRYVDLRHGPEAAAAGQMDRVKLAGVPLQILRHARVSQCLGVHGVIYVVVGLSD
jgi:hypothetical protein